MSKLTGWIQDRETGAYEYRSDRADLCEFCEQAKHCCECGEYAPHQCPCPVCETERERLDLAPSDEFEDGCFIPRGAVAPF